MTRIYYDIETAPLPEAELRPLLPPFDAAEVKLGNLKDAVKIAEKLKEAEANHAADFFERAALDPLTGRVVAIGALLVTPAYDREAGEPNRAPAGKEFLILADDDEKKLLANFWALVRGDHGRLNPIIGFNSNLFDLPFLIRRSWKHGLNVPAGIRRGRYWGDQVIDLRDCWQLGDRQARGSLGVIAQHLGVGAKLAAPAANGETKTIKGGEFAGLWVSNRNLAEAYLRNDVELTEKIADALGVAI